MAALHHHMLLCWYCSCWTKPCGKTKLDNIYDLIFGHNVHLTLNYVFEAMDCDTLNLHLILVYNTRVLPAYVIFPFIPPQGKCSRAARIRQSAQKNLQCTSERLDSIASIVCIGLFFGPCCSTRGGAIGLGVRYSLECGCDSDLFS